MTARTMTQVFLLPPWMELTSGKKFIFGESEQELGFSEPPDLLEDLCIPLARTKRFCGHGREPWSVAKHTLVAVEYAVMRKFSAVDIFDVAMHDVPEAIVGDMTSPLKSYLFRDPVQEIRLRNIENAVNLQARQVLGLGDCSVKYSIGDIHGERVRQADLAALLVEAVDSMPSAGHGWDVLPHIDLTPSECRSLLEFSQSPAVGASSEASEDGEKVEVPQVERLEALHLSMRIKGLAEHCRRQADMEKIRSQRAAEEKR